MQTELNIKEAGKLKLSNYGRGELIKAQQLADETSVFFPADPVIIVSEYDGEFHYERTEIKLFHPVIDLRIEHDTNKKKYRISCRTESTYRNIGYVTFNDLEKPNVMGVLSAKKVQEWVKYYETKCKRLAALEGANVKKISDFKASLKGLSVKWNENGGEIIRNGLKYTFSIDRGYISQGIKLDYVDDNLKTFLELSDNKYTKNKKA